MAIDRQSGNSERVTENDIGRLATNARQLHEILHCLWHLAAVVRHHFSGHPEKRPRLAAKEPGRLDLWFELRSGRFRKRLWIGIALEEGRRNLIDALVGALRREDGRDQELERV